MKVFVRGFLLRRLDNNKFLGVSSLGRYLFINSFFVDFFLEDVKIDMQQQYKCPHDSVRMLYPIPYTLLTTRAFFSFFLNEFFLRRGGEEEAEGS